MPALLAQLLSLRQQSFPPLLPFFDASRQRDGLVFQVKHFSATLQQASRFTDLPTGDDPGRIQDLSCTRYEDGPIGRRERLLFPQHCGIPEGLDKHHSIEEIVTGRFTMPFHLDHIHCTSDHTGPALHRGPPRVRGRIPKSSSEVAAE